MADPSDGITPSEDDVARQLQSLSPQSISPVVELLRDPDGDVRELAGYVLRDMPGLGPAHLGALERAVEAGDGWLPPAIASIGTPEAVRFLVGQLKEDPEEGTQLTYAFERLGPAAFPELLELFRCGTSCDEPLLRVVGAILSEVRESAAAVVDPLARIACEQAASLTARRSAIRALCGLGATARPAVNALLEMTHQEPVKLQTEARRALLGIGGPGTKDALDASLAGAKDKGLVLMSIAALGEGGREAGPNVETLLGSHERDVRVSAALALGFIGYRPSAPALVAALDDADDWRLVFAATEALGRLRAQEARQALQSTASGHWYPPVRDAARTALRALHGTYRYPSASEEANSAGGFLEYQRAARRYPPCADSEGSRRTIPEDGLRVEGGWLVGANRGEWGGELLFRSDTGATSMVLAKNISGLHLLEDGHIVAVTGLAHMGVDEGDLFSITCAPGSGCYASRWKVLPGAPRSSWLIETGALLVNTTGGSVLVTPGGTLKMVDCDAGTRPAERPGR